MIKRNHCAVKHLGKLWEHSKELLCFFVLPQLSREPHNEGARQDNLTLAMDNLQYFDTITRSFLQIYEYYTYGTTEEYHANKIALFFKTPRLKSTQLTHSADFTLKLEF